MAPLSRGAMRIVALPLLRPANATASKVPTFYSFRITPPPPKPKTAASRSRWMRWVPEEGLGKWTAHKASRTWADWGMAPKGTMRQRAFQLGETLMDRLDFEESNLKAIDLSIAPPLEVNGKTVEAVKDGEVPLLYPPMMLSGPQSLDHLRALVQERIPMHTRGVFVWIFFAVLSAPLKLIPIIPNFPFYFCAWRSWSHLKGKRPSCVARFCLTTPKQTAMRAARYTQGLIQSNIIVPQPLKDLNAVYGNPAPHRKMLNASGADLDPALVSRQVLDRAVRALDMPPDETKELLRAHEQVVSRKVKGRQKH